jgi:hypothetical protein
MTGTATLDFGAFPGATDTTATVTGQGAILSNSFVEAWILPAVTPEHNADEHWVEEMDVLAGNVVAGTGFTIYVVTRNYRLYGRWNVGWVWA